MNLTMPLIKADIIAAKQAIAYYNDHGVKDIKNIAAYHLQQAAEKLIKIQIYNKTTDYDSAALYTHNIEKLIVYATSLELDINIPNYIKENSLVLTSWEAGSRYDVAFQIRIDTLNKTLSEIEKWYNQIYKSGIRNG